MLLYLKVIYYFYLIFKSGLIKVAEQENAAFISHGATGKGNDQVKLKMLNTNLFISNNFYWFFYINNQFFSFYTIGYCKFI